MQKHQDILQQVGRMALATAGCSAGHLCSGWAVYHSGIAGWPAGHCDCCRQLSGIKHYRF